MYKITDIVVGAQQIASFSSTLEHPLGTIVRATDPTYGAGEFIYLKGVASTVVGSWVTYDLDDGVTALLVADAIGPVAIAMSANIVATTYGWYQINGAGIGVAVAAVDDGDDLYCSTAAGEVNDTAITGDRVWGVKAAAATTAAGSVLVNINRPFVNNAVNAGTS